MPEISFIPTNLDIPLSGATEFDHPNVGKLLYAVDGALRRADGSFQAGDKLAVWSPNPVAVINMQQMQTALNDIFGGEQLKVSNLSLHQCTYGSLIMGEICQV